MAPLPSMTALEIAGQVRSGEISPCDVIRDTLELIHQKNPAINAFVTLREEQALEEARLMGEDIAAGKDPGPLAGVPIGVKDLEDVADMVTSYGSTVFKDNRVYTDSVQVARLKAAGAIIVGKTNTPEFGFTGFTKNRLHGVTRNPWNLEKTPGGSSGGSAAAVASGMVPLATGSDAGGSVRIPASYSGCFGIKPSYGRIPLGPSPILPMSRTLALGPLTRTVSDAALYLDSTAGYHPADPDALPPPTISYLEGLNKDLRKLNIGFSPTLGYAQVQRDVLSIVENAVHLFEEMGHRVEIWDGNIPEVGQLWAEITASDIYAQLAEDLERFRSELGKSLVSSLDYVKGLPLDRQVENQKTRTLLNQRLWEFFNHYDLLITPTMPTEAFLAKGPPPSEIEGHPIPLLGAVAFTYPFNLSGHPAATVRAGLTESGLPAGMQIIGPRLRDDLVLQASFAYEKAAPWNDRWPFMDALFDVP